MGTGLKITVMVGLALFTLLSATDWVLTYTLLNIQPAAVEANPLAAAWLDQHGWEGLALYKFGSVVVFFGAVGLLLRRRPAIATTIIGAGCAVLLAVNFYSHDLIRDAHDEHRYRDLSGMHHHGTHQQDRVLGVAIPSKCWFAIKAADGKSARE